jgi:hypothetical protein
VIIAKLMATCIALPQGEADARLCCLADRKAHAAQRPYTRLRRRLSPNPNRQHDNDLAYVKGAARMAGTIRAHPPLIPAAPENWPAAANVPRPGGQPNCFSANSGHAIP